MLVILDDTNKIKAFIDGINTVNVEYLINKEQHNKHMAKITCIIIKI